MTEQIDNLEVCFKHTCCAEGCCSDDVKMESVVKALAVMDVVRIQVTAV